MPHVVVTGDLAPADAAEALGPVTDRQEDLILRTKETYLASSGELLPVEGAVIEGGRPLNVIATVSRRDDGLVVRIAPFMEATPRTDGVQRFIAWLGQRIHDSRPDLGFGKTNLEAYLEPGAAAAQH